MKALQDRSVTQEGVINRLRKRNETLTNEQEQYKWALRTLNKEVTALTKKLKKETHLQEKAQEAKANLETKLMVLYEQVETAKVDAIAKFKASRPFIDAFAVYYGDEFEDCLKQVRSVYPNLDLSKVTMENPLPTTFAGDDTTNEETNDSTHTKQGSKDDSVVLAQPAQERPVTPLILSAEDPPLKDAWNPSA